MKRSTDSKEIAATNSEATTESFSTKQFSGGVVSIPSGSTVTQLDWYFKVGDTYYPAYDSSGNIIQQTVSANKCYQMPDGVFGSEACKIVITGDTSEDLGITLKS